MSKIEPALTASDWAAVRKYGLSYQEARYGPRACFSQHEVAALCLHGQAFGFTREDVEVLREAAGKLGKLKPNGYSLPKESERLSDDLLAVLLNDLARRIEALLPPEAP